MGVNSTQRPLLVVGCFMPYGALVFDKRSDDVDCNLYFALPHRSEQYICVRLPLTVHPFL